MSEHQGFICGNLFLGFFKLHKQVICTNYTRALFFEIKATMCTINIIKSQRRGRRDNKGTAGINCAHHSKRQWGQQSFSSKAKRTLGGNKWILQMWGSKAFTTLQDARDAWITSPVLMSYTPFPAVHNNDSVHCKQESIYKNSIVPRARGAGQMLNHTSLDAWMYK